MKDTEGAAQQSPDAPQGDGAMKIQFKSRAWITGYTPMQEFLKILEGGDAQSFGDRVHFSNSDMNEGEFGWTEVGTGTITVELHTRDVLVQSQLDVLRSRLAKERAESMRRQNFILDSISKLSALTYEAEA